MESADVPGTGCPGLRAFYRGSGPGGATREWRRRGLRERRAPSARAGPRVAPFQVVPDHNESCRAAIVGGNR
jgi:hypothetical protein